MMANNTTHFLYGLAIFPMAMTVLYMMVVILFTWSAMEWAPIALSCGYTGPKKEGDDRFQTPPTTPTMTMTSGLITWTFAYRMIAILAFVGTMICAPQTAGSARSVVWHRVAFGLLWLLQAALCWLWIRRVRQHWIDGGIAPVSPLRPPLTRENMKPSEGAPSADKQQQEAQHQQQQSPIQIFIVITGANAGIGWHTTHQLADWALQQWTTTQTTTTTTMTTMGSNNKAVPPRAAVVTLVLACRNEQKAAAAVRDIQHRLQSSIDNGGAKQQQQLRLEMVTLDLASLQSVRNAASDLHRRFPSTPDALILINNAGLVNKDCAITEDGYELVFQANHLGHFLWTQLLIQYYHPGFLLLDDRVIMEPQDNNPGDDHDDKVMAMADTPLLTGNAIRTNDSAATTTTTISTATSRVLRGHEIDNSKTCATTTASVCTPPRHLIAVVNVTSSMYRLVPHDAALDWERIALCSTQHEKQSYSMFGQYSRSKLANILFTREFERRWDLCSKQPSDALLLLPQAASTTMTSTKPLLVTAAIHPGAVRTDVVQNMPWYMKWPNYWFGVILATVQKTPPQGAWCTVSVVQRSVQAYCEYMHMIQQKEESVKATTTRSSTAEGQMTIDPQHQFVQILDNCGIQSGRYWVNQQVQQLRSVALRNDLASSLWTCSTNMVLSLSSSSSKGKISIQSDPTSDAGSNSKNDNGTADKVSRHGDDGDTTGSTCN